MEKKPTKEDCGKGGLKGAGVGWEKIVKKGLEEDVVWHKASAGT